MPTLFKLTEAGSIALHAAVYLAGHQGRACAAGEIARALRVSEAHLVKVLQRLSRVGLVTPVRGPKGGYGLHPAAGRRTLNDVLEAIEGQGNGVRCLFRRKPCDGVQCAIGCIFQAVQRQVQAYLAGTRLDAVPTLFPCAQDDPPAVRRAACRARRPARATQETAG